MRALVFFFRGYAIVELTGAEPERCLNRFAQRGIAFWAVEKPDELHLRCRVLLRDVQAADMKIFALWVMMTKAFIVSEVQR